MSIFITGASGFVGQNLVHYLNAKFECRALNRSELQTVSPDLLDSSFAVVHLAGKAHDLKKVASPDDYYAVNFELTKKIFDAFLQSSAKKFIYVSSVKAVADSLDHVLDENMIPNPQTHYGKSKLMAEQYIKSQRLPDDKSYYILRPCMIHGPGNKGNLNLLFKLVKKGIPYPLASFINNRSFLTVQNLCFIISEVIVRDDIGGGIYNVADDKPLSTNEVITILSQALKKKPKLWNVSPSIIKLLAKAGDLLNLPLTTERLEKLTEDFVVSNDKIKRALKKPLPLTAAQGMLETAEFFKG